VLAVATGPHPASELIAADAVAADGWELAAVLARALEAGDPAPQRTSRL
jgi:hypothetical protein